MITTTVGRTALEAKVKDMYTAVANRPDGEFHFEMGRAMAAPGRIARSGPPPDMASRAFPCWPASRRT